MANKELKKLNRTELLELLLLQTKETERLQEQLKKTEAMLAEKNLRIREAGNLADAVLAVNKVAETTQAAAQQYLDNIAAMENDVRILCGKKILAVRREAEKILLNARREAEQIVSAARREAEQIRGRETAAPAETPANAVRKKVPAAVGESRKVIPSEKRTANVRTAVRNEKTKNQKIN